jgi:hypothetical protein
VEEEWTGIGWQRGGWMAEIGREWRVEEGRKIQRSPTEKNQPQHSNIPNPVLNSGKSSHGTIFQWEREESARQMPSGRKSTRIHARWSLLINPPVIPGIGIFRSLGLRFGRT